MRRIDSRYQQLLKDLGIYDGNIDGIQGPKTTAGIQAFQRLNGLIADGIVGTKTRAEFEEQLNENPDRVELLDAQPYNIWPRETTAELNKFYGVPDLARRIAPRQTRIKVPYPMVLAWDTDKSISEIMCHELVAPSLLRILENVADTYTPQEIQEYGLDMFGGVTNVRTIRGGTRLSTHSWGIAIDIDPARNRLKWDSKKAFLARPECDGFRNAFRAEGWYSLGENRDYDWMHFQACWR